MGRGLENCYSFPSVRGVQAGRAYYVAMVPFGAVERIFQPSQVEHKTLPLVGRHLNKARVPAIAQYVVRSESYVIPPVHASVEGAIKFESVGGLRSVGKLFIELTATIRLVDGRHRLAGIARALQSRPHLTRDTIAVSFYPSDGPARSQQMFEDLNRTAIRPQHYRSAGEIHNLRR